MIGEIIGLGVDMCVSAVLKASVPAGKTIGSRFVRAVGTAAISYAVGQETERLIDKAKSAYVKAVDSVYGYEINEEEVEAE